MELTCIRILHYAATTKAKTPLKRAKKTDPSFRETPLPASLELEPEGESEPLAAGVLEVDEPVLLAILPSSEAASSAGILNVCAAGGYWVKPVQVGND